MEKLTPIKDENTGMWTLEGVEPWHVTYAKFIHFIVVNYYPITIRY